MTDGIDELAKVLEKPRAIRLLADWMAIDKGETRNQGAKYIKDAEELYDYLIVIGFRLIAELRLPLIDCPKQTEIYNLWRKCKETAGDLLIRGIEAQRQYDMDKLKPPLPSEGEK